MIVESTIMNDIVFESLHLPLQRVAGIYLVAVVHPDTKMKRILYVGSTRDIKNRVKYSKHPYYICFNRFKSYHVIIQLFNINRYDRKYRFSLEKEAIKYFRPLFNKKHKE